MRCAAASPRERPVCLRRLNQPLPEPRPALQPVHHSHPFRPLHRHGRHIAPIQQSRPTRQQSQSQISRTAPHVENRPAGNLPILHRKHQRRRQMRGTGHGFVEFELNCPSIPVYWNLNLLHPLASMTRFFIFPLRRISSTRRRCQQREEHTVEPTSKDIYSVHHETERRSK